MPAPRTGVCLLYMGGPESLEQVEPFLLELFADRQLIRLPGGPLVQGPLGRFIARRRAPKVRERYRLIGGGSPLVRTTLRQAELLQALLRRELDDDSLPVAVAMRYSEPRAEQALRALRRAGVERLVTLPLYPHFSSATTGSSYADLERALERMGWSPELRRVQSFHDHPAYIEALAGSVRQGLEQLSPGAPVLFSAHSLPQRLVQRGDPYQQQVERTTELVTQALGLERVELGYQSRSGPVRWLEPDVLDLVRRHGAARTRELLVVAVSFVSDHIETLHEIDIDMRDLALSCGVGRFARAPSLNDAPAFIHALGQITIETCQTTDQQTAQPS